MTYRLEHTEFVYVEHRSLVLIFKSTENGAELGRKHLWQFRDKDAHHLDKVMAADDKLVAFGEMCDALQKEWLEMGFHFGSSMWQINKHECQSQFLDWKPLLDRGLVEVEWIVETDKIREEVTVRNPISRDPEKLEKFIDFVRRNP